MARPKSNGPYAPLSAIYYRDDAILEVGEFAELMFVRCLAFLADAASDGFITERQMRIVVGMGLDQVPERVAALVDVGLLERIDGGFIVRSWLKWNKSTDEIGKHLKRDRERKASGKNTDSSAIPGGIRLDSRDQYRAIQSNTDHNTKEPSSDAEASDPEFSPDVIRLCDLLGDLVTANHHKVGNIGITWWSACERLIRIDGYTAEQIEWVMRWACERSEFWPANIRSMPTLRTKFSTLKAQALKDSGQGRKLTNAERNLIEFQQKYGGDSVELEGSQPAFDSSVSY